jgi:hypothetical protein
MRYLERRNPHNTHWGLMKLFLHCQVACDLSCAISRAYSQAWAMQVEVLSFARYGGEAGLDAELQRRQDACRKRKEEQQVKKVAKVGLVSVAAWAGMRLRACVQLRKQTMTSLWRDKPVLAAHEHDFAPEVPCSASLCVMNAASYHTPAGAERADEGVGEAVPGVRVCAVL